MTAHLEAMPIYSAYNVPLVEGITFTDRSMAQQHMRDDCNINNIIKRLTRKDVQNLQQTIGEFGDISEAPMDYNEAVNLINSMDELFLELPSHVRERFNNNPYDLQVFLEDPNNLQEAYSMGFLQPQEAEDVRTSGGDAPKASPEEAGSDHPAT